MPENKSPKYSNEAIELFETVIQEFHRLPFANIRKQANTKQTVTLEMMRQAILETCGTISNRFESVNKSSGDRQVA